MRTSVFNFTNSEPQRAGRVPPGGVSTFSFGDEYAQLPKQKIVNAVPEKVHPTDHKLFGPITPKEAAGLNNRVVRPQVKDTCGQILHDPEHMPASPVHHHKKHAVVAPKETNDLLDMNRKAEPLLHSAKKHSVAAPKETNDLLELHAEPVSVPVTHFAKKHVDPKHHDCTAILAEQPVAVPVIHRSRKTSQADFTKDHWNAQVLGTEKAPPAPPVHAMRAAGTARPSTAPAGQDRTVPSTQPQSAESVQIPGRRQVQKRSDNVGGLIAHADIQAGDRPFRGRANLGGQQTFIIGQTVRVQTKAKNYHKHALQSR